MSKDSKSQDLIGREEYGYFRVQKEFQDFPDRAGPSSTAEGRFEQQHDVETEEGDNKGSNTEDFVVHEVENFSDTMKNLDWSFTTQIMKHSRSHWHTSM